MAYLYIITGALVSLLSPVPTATFPFRRSELDPLPESSSDNVECFLDYMELWVLRRRINGLLLWLSQVMRFPVSLSSLDRSNHLISGCRYALDMDSNGNFIFRAHYTACNVQTQNGFHVLEIHMVKKTSAGGGHSDRYLMRCPAMMEALGSEKVRCDPNYVQVTRPVPLGTSDDQEWFLLFRGELVVSVDDASLIGVEAEISNVSVTVRGPRGPLLDTKEFLDRQTNVLPLWLARGFYAYSLEASCPPVSQHPGNEVTLHIPKQRMGLVKRGSYVTETLTVRNIAPRQPISVTVTENKHFVMITVPAKEVLQRQDCYTAGNNERGVQVFYSIGLVLEFAEVAYTMNWTLANFYECTALPPNITQPRTFPAANENVELSANITANGTATWQKMTALAITANAVGKDWPVTSIPGSLDAQRAQDRLYSARSVPGPKNRSQDSTVELVATTEPGEDQSAEPFDIGFSGSGDTAEVQHLHQDRTAHPSDLEPVTQDSFTGYPTAPSKLPVGSTEVTRPPNTVPPLPQEEQPYISYHLGINSGIYYNENIPSFIYSKLTDVSSPAEGQNMTFAVKVTEEETRPTIASSVTKVTENGGPEKVNPDTYSPRSRQGDSSKPGHQLNWDSQPGSGTGKSTSPQRLTNDTSAWEMLKGETLFELLEETTREGLMSPVYKGRKDIKLADKMGSEKALAKGKRKPTDATLIPNVTGDGKQTGDLQYTPDTKRDQPPALLGEESILPSKYLDSSDWTLYSRLPEETLNHAAMELETMGSAEQLLLST